MARGHSSLSLKGGSHAGDFGFLGAIAMKDGLSSSFLVLTFPLGSLSPALSLLGMRVWCQVMEF